MLKFIFLFRWFRFVRSYGKLNNEHIVIEWNWFYFSGKSNIMINAEYICVCSVWPKLVYYCMGLDYITISGLSSVKWWKKVKINQLCLFFFWKWTIHLIGNDVIGDVEQSPTLLYTMFGYYFQAHPHMQLCIRRRVWWWHWWREKKMIIVDVRF